MQILKKIKNPLAWILIALFKIFIRRLFFKNISNNDFNRLFVYVLEVLPNETIIAIFKLLKNTFFI